MSSKCYEFLSVAGFSTLMSLVTVVLNDDVGCPTSWLQRYETGSCYFISNSTLDFYDATASCLNMSASLTSILDSETNDFLFGAVNGNDWCGGEQWCSKFWIGLYHSNETSTNDTLTDGWTWADGSSFSRTWNNWSPSGNYSCAGLVAVEREWRDMECSTDLRYICQKKFAVSSLTSRSSISSVDFVTNRPTLEMSSMSLTSVSENRLTVSTISSTTSSQAVAATVNQSTVLFLASNVTASLPDISENQSKMPFISTAVNSLPATTSERPSNSSVTTVTQFLRFNSSSTAKNETSMDSLSTYATREEGNFSDNGRTLPSVSTVSDSAATTFYAEESNTTSNDTGLLQGESLMPMLAIYIAVPLGILIVVIVITVVACVLCKRFRKKRESAAMFLSTQGRMEIINDYENLDTVIGHLELMSGVSSRNGTGVSWLTDIRGDHTRRPRGPTPLRAAATYLTIGIGTVPDEDFRQLNDYLLTLKRPLENFLVNEIFTDDMKSLINEVSSKIIDMIQKSRDRRVLSTFPLLHVGARDLLCSNFLFLESLLSLQLKIVTLLRFFPIEGAERCHQSLETMNALLKLATENAPNTQMVRPDWYDVLYEVNPLFEELLGALTLVRVRLETYSVLGSLAEPDEPWKSKLLDSLSEISTSLREAFSDVVEQSDDTEPEPVADDDTFHDILEKKLMAFRQSMDGVMPQVKQFLHGVNSNASLYVTAVLDEVVQLTSNILNPTYLTLSRDEGSDSTVYQNLVDGYDFPQTVTYHNLPSFVPQSNDDPFVAEFRRYGVLADGLAEDDIYEESPVLNMLNRLDDLNSAYSFEDDSFEVTVDRTCAMWLENVFQLYRDTPVEQLQRNIKVTFTGEAGLDGGALSREFFFMSFNGLISQPIMSHELFEGSRGHLLPAIDHVLTDARGYWFVGVLTAQAVNKGCKGLPGLCNAVRHFLFSGAKISNIKTSLELVTAKDVADLELRMVVTKVLKGEELTDEERVAFETWACDSNFSKVLGPSTHAEAVQRIFCHYVFNSRMTQIQAIAEGMLDVGIRNRSSVEIERIFPVDEKLTYDDLMSGVVMEPRNSSQRRTRDHFRRFCQELYKGRLGTLTLEDLLRFFTGAPYFASMVGAQVKFAEPDEQSSLPVAHACASELILPTVHKSYGHFRTAMVKALEYSGTGFGLV